MSVQQVIWAYNKSCRKNSSVKQKLRGLKEMIKIRLAFKIFFVGCSQCVFFRMSSAGEPLWYVWLDLAPNSCLCTVFLTLSRPEGGERGAQAGSSLCCAETVSSRKIKLCDFYLVYTNKLGINLEYKPVPWDIHCCHDNAIV